VVRESEAVTVSDSVDFFADDVDKASEAVTVSVSVAFLDAAVVSES